MARETKTVYSCDNCGKRLHTCENRLNIITSKNESEIGWSRLHVMIKHRHGSHNDAKTDDADLCQACAIKLIADALARVKSGERASKGAESPEQEGWDS